MNFNELIKDNEIPDIAYRTKDRPETVHPTVIFENGIPYVICKKTRVTLETFLVRYANNESGMWLAAMRKSDRKRTTITFAQKERLTLGSRFIGIINQIQKTKSTGLNSKELVVNEESKKTSSISSADEFVGGNILKIEQVSNLQKKMESALSDLDQRMPGEDIDAIVKRRVGQTLFRDLLESQHGSSCHISQMSTRRLLIASHIVPWSKSKGNEKTDPYNGLLLAVNWDAVFDKWLITFDNEGKVIFSKTLDKETRELLGIDSSLCLRAEVIKNERLDYLKHHREEFDKREAMLSP